MNDSLLRVHQDGWLVIAGCVRQDVWLIPIFPPASSPQRHSSKKKADIWKVHLVFTLIVSSLREHDCCVPLLLINTKLLSSGSALVSVKYTDH